MEGRCRQAPDGRNGGFHRRTHEREPRTHQYVRSLQAREKEARRLFNPFSGLKARTHKKHAQPQLNACPFPPMGQRDLFHGRSGKRPFFDIEDHASEKNAQRLRKMEEKERLDQKIAVCCT